MIQFFKRLWADEFGQSTTEYILILAVVVMITMKFKSVFSKSLGTLIDKLGGDIESAESSNTQQ